jgi:hypothetical protein
VCCSALRRPSTATYSAYTRTRTHTTVTQLQHEREHPATRADREAVVFRLPRGRDDSECACVSRHRRSVERYCGCDVYNCRGHLAARSGFGVAGACDHRRRQQRIRITPQVTSTARLAFVGWRLSCGRHTRETTRSQKPPQWRAAVARKTDAHSSRAQPRGTQNTHISHAHVRARGAGSQQARHGWARQRHSAPLPPKQTRATATLTLPLLVRRNAHPVRHFGRGETRHTLNAVDSVSVWMVLHDCESLCRPVDANISPSPPPARSQLNLPSTPPNLFAGAKWLWGGFLRSLSRTHRWLD